ncbi:MAG: DUF481 domain-containing protein [Pirellulales bacterium]
MNESSFESFDGSRGESPVKLRLQSLMSCAVGLLLILFVGMHSASAQTGSYVPPESPLTLVPSSPYGGPQVGSLPSNLPSYNGTTYPSAPGYYAPGNTSYPVQGTGQIPVGPGSYATQPPAPLPIYVPSNGAIPQPPSVPSIPSLPPDNTTVGSGVGAAPPAKEALPTVEPSSKSDSAATDAKLDDLDVRSITRNNWYYPWAWFPWDGWTNSAELGLNGSSGNANSFSFQTGAKFKRSTDKNLFDFRISHNRTQANGVEKQNNALAYADFDRFFGDSPWSAFIKQGIEYDRFKAFDVRYNINPGLAYRFVKTERLSLQGRFGAGTSREFGGPDDRWVPEALFGASYEHQLNKRNKWVAKIDYFPEWGNFGNYRIVSDTSWEMLWDEVGNLSFKIGAVDRYDSTPNGKQPNDLNYSMLLLYKF